LAALGSGAILIGIPMVLTTAASAYRHDRSRTFAAIAFAIGVIEVFVLAGWLLGGFLER
jgi:hypothetical protein